MVNIYTPSHSQNKINSAFDTNSSTHIEQQAASSAYANPPMMLSAKSKDDIAIPSKKDTDPMNGVKNNEFVLMRTVAVSPKEELVKQANTNSKINTLGTPSTLVFLNGDPKFVTISSIQTPETAKNKWGGKPNLIFVPTTRENNLRTGTTIVLDQPATLHSCSSGSVVKKYNLTVGPPNSDLHERMKTKGQAIEESWEQGGFRNGRNKGMYGKYTEYAAHDNVQGKMFYQQAKKFVDEIRDAIPHSGSKLRSYVVEQTKFDAAADIQKKIFKSQQKYANFLSSSSSESKSPETVKSVRAYENYLSTKPDPEKNYFEVIGETSHSAMRMELLQHYEKYSHSGYRHNEVLGRLFPWEAHGIDIGHVDDLTDKADLSKHFSHAKRFSMEYEKSRKDMASEFESQKFSHPVIKEFIDAKNGLLLDKGEPPLNESEKNNILQRILVKMNEPLQTYSYQKGELERVDLPGDITVGGKNSPKDSLTKENFVKLSNRLRSFFNKQERVSKDASSPSLKPLPEAKIQPTPNTIINDENLIKTAKKALEAFLATKLDFDLHSSPEDSGALFIKILKNSNPSLSDRDIVLKNLDKFSLDNCMSIISSMHAKDWASRVKNESVSSDTKASDYKAFSYIDYDESVLHNYAAATKDTKNLDRPQLDTKTGGHTFSFKQLEANVQENMKDAWSKRNNKDTAFASSVNRFFNEVKSKYEIDLSDITSSNDISSIWDKVLSLQEEKFGEKHNYELSKGLFEALGADWSRSKDTRDESLFRQEYDKSEWNINPHGIEYRQHKTGKGNLVTFAPSEKAINIAEQEIEKGRNPFKNLEDMYAVLDKVKDNQTDRFALHAIFMDKEVLSGPSSSSLRMLNFWERDVLPNLSDQDRKLAPSLDEIAQLNEAYNTKGKHHHSTFEVESVTRNRNIQNKII